MFQVYPSADFGHSDKLDRKNVTCPGCHIIRSNANLNGSPAASPPADTRFGPGSDHFFGRASGHFGLSVWRRFVLWRQPDSAGVGLLCCCFGGAVCRHPMAGSAKRHCWWHRSGSGPDINFIVGRHADRYLDIVRYSAGYNLLWGGGAQPEYFLCR